MQPYTPPVTRITLHPTVFSIYNNNNNNNKGLNIDSFHPGLTVALAFHPLTHNTLLHLLPPPLSISQQGM
jgi:hypothetical protein